MFHCGDFNERANVLSYSERVSESLSERIENFPLLEERARVRCLTEREKLEILRSSSTDLLQSNGLSLRMTSAFDKSGKLRPEQSEEFQAKEITIANGLTPHPSLLPKEKENSCCYAELIGNFPSPREEGVGEKVFPFVKIKILKLIQEINFNISLQKEFIGVPQIK